jgi:ferredoxin
MVLKAWPEPNNQKLCLDFQGLLVSGVKPGRQVAKGQLLAKASLVRHSDTHSPVSGRLIKVLSQQVTIEAGPDSGGLPPSPLPLTGLFGFELAKALRSLGVPTPRPPGQGQPALLTALVSEPGLETGAALWNDQRTTLTAGADILARLWPETQLWEVLPRGLEPLGASRVIINSDRYPLTHPIFLKKSILGLYDPKASGVVEPRILWAMGFVARGGMPLTHLPVTIQRSHYLAPLGLRLSDALEGVNLSPQKGDAVVIGGLITGRPASNLSSGLGWSSPALHLIRARHLPPSPEPCRRCLRCRLACPLDLPIDLLGALSMDQWPKASISAPELLSGCPACGACALACPAARPLLAIVLSAQTLRQGF